MNVKKILIEDFDLKLKGDKITIIHKELDLISISSEEDSFEIFNAKVIIGHGTMFIYGTIKFRNGDIMSGAKIKCLV
jgi:hypothetical protein